MIVVSVLFSFLSVSSLFATNSIDQMNVVNDVINEEDFRRDSLFEEKYQLLLHANERLERELDRNLTLIAIIVGVFGVILPLALLLYSRYSVDKIIENNNMQLLSLTKKAEETALQTAQNLDEYKKQNTLRELMSEADDEEDHSRAIELYSRALDLDERNKVALMRRAKRYRNIGKFADAIKDYKKVITLYPDYIIGYSVLGLTYFDLGNIDDAESEYKKALSIDPTYATALARMANVYYKKKDFVIALDYIDRALAQNSESIAYHKRRLKILKAQNIVGNREEIIREESVIKTLDAES